MRTGRPLQDRCKRGHDMRETRRRYLNGNTYCEACRTVFNKAWVKAHPEKRKQTARRTRLKRVYRLTDAGFDEMLAKQDNACAICKTKEWGEKGPHVDHDHKTGKLRGILCGRCDVGVAMFGDDSDVMRQAARYIEMRSEVQLARAS